ncbi:MAG: hypothetical protein J6A25_07630 [Lachnospiraceae bacterium]|nr:hypothetical protein [Lachnospiraceae bacterium]MBO5425368.1 hypothetical protein [Lachnospiraceae bacterium]
MKFIRAFKKKDEAEQFINGEVFIRPISTYATLPESDQRRDVSEGGLDYFTSVDITKPIQTINHIDGTQTVILIEQAMKEGYLHPDDYCYIHTTAKLHQLSVGLFNGVMTEEMKLRYRGFGNYWVIGEGSELLSNLADVDTWLGGYKVFYSDDYAGFWCKSLAYKQEQEFKSLFRLPNGTGDTTVSMRPLSTARLYIVS